MSPAALTPALALDLVRELSADVRAVLILSAGGERLAGPSELAAAAQRAGGRRRRRAGGRGASPRTASSASRATATHVAIAVCGPFAIPGVVRADLRAALAGIEGGAVPPRA